MLPNQDYVSDTVVAERDSVYPERRCRSGDSTETVQDSSDSAERFAIGLPMSKHGRVPKPSVREAQRDHQSGQEAHHRESRSAP